MAKTKRTARKSTQPPGSDPSSNLDPDQDMPSHYNTGNPDAVFTAGKIVAYINESTPDGYSLAKLQDDAFETQENVQVSFLQENEQNGDNIVYIISMSGEVKIDQILREIPFKPKRQKGRKGMEMYQVARKDLDGLGKIVDQTKNIGTIKASEEKNEPVHNSSDSSSEGEENSEESEGEGDPANIGDTPRVLKKVKGPKKKGDKKGKGEKEDLEKDNLLEEEVKEEAEKAPTKRGRGGKRASVSRVSKKKAVESGELATKDVDFDLDEEEKKDQGDENQDKKKKKEKEKEKKPKSIQRKPMKTVPDTYKKGKFNTKVKVVTHHDLLQNKSNDPIDYGCTRTNNKNLIRAVYTQNYTLLENLLAKQRFLSTLHEQWGPENDTTALSLALKNRDVKAVKLILDCEYARNYYFAPETPIHLQNVDTGNVSKAAFGVEIRKVNLMRGAREGNNAFTHDLTTHALDFDALFELPMSTEILDYLRLKAGNHRIFSNIHKLIFSGDRINAGYLVNLANSVGGYGFNYLHEEALTKEKASELTPNIKRVSVTKKVIGNSTITPLHCAAINPNVEILDALLEIAPDYSIPDEKMRKLVHYAACCEKPGPLKLLISKGVDPREKDQTGLTPFMYACYYGRAENVEYLLKVANVDPLAKTKDGMMGSHWAASRGHLGVLKILVENDVKMSVKGGKSKMTPLHFAAAYGYYDCVEYLVEHKSRVLAKDKFKRTPLSVAVRNGNLQVASYLLFNGSDFEQADSSNNFALHYAAAYGFTECIDILIKAGANVNVANSWKLTALTVAMLKNNFHCVKALLAYPETDVNAKDDHGKSLISLLIGNPSEENFERIMYLIKDRKCNVNTEDEEGVTPLHLACQLSAGSQTVPGSDSLKIQLIKLLLESGANVNAKTKAGQFPLLFSITHFDSDLIELLIQQEGIDLAFHDRDRNNLYRLLYQHTINNDGRWEFLKRILQKIGNISNLLNEVKNDVVITVNQQKPKTQNQNYSAKGRVHRRKAEEYDNDDEGDDEDEDEEEDEEEEEEEMEEENYDTANNNVNNYTYIQPNSSATNPLSCNESVFTCFKRTLMGDTLQNYINTEINNALSIKRQQQNYNYYYYDIQLTEQETAECKEKAIPKFDATVTKNLDLIGEFIKAGATLPQDEASILRPEYSNDPRFLVWVLEMFKTDLNVADPSGNPVLYNLITRRNNLQMTPNAKQFLVDYLINHHGLEADTLSKYSDFKLFLEVYHRFGANFNYRNTTGTTPILHLLKNHDKGNAESLMDLIFYGADIHQARDNNGSTPFLEAIYANDLKLLEVLVPLEVDINHKSKSGKAPLHHIIEMWLASAVTATNIVLKLKNIDVNIRDQDNNRTPLHYAILKGARELVTVLLQAGADPNMTDRSGCSSLYFATQIRDEILMRKIGAVTTNPSAAGGLEGLSPLHLSVQNGSEEQVNILLKLGAEPNAKDNTGKTPLMMAVMNDKFEIVKTLLASGGNPNEKEKTGKTSLMMAVMDEKFEIVKTLLASGGNPNERDQNDRTCLHYAVNNSKPEQMFEMEDLLIRNKADVNAIDIYGRSPLHYSFITIENNYHFHNQNDPVETVTSLSAMEITNISLKDRRGKSPLHYAAENGAYICVLLLLKRQVAFDDPDADGNTPLALSLNAGHKDTAAILIQNRAKVTSMIHHINTLNYLWVSPKDNPYNNFVKTPIQAPNDDNKMNIITENREENGVTTKPEEKDKEGMEIEQPELAKGTMNVEEQKEEKEDKDSDDLEEEDEEIEEGGTEDLDQEEAKARELEVQGMDLPVEVQPEEKKAEPEPETVNINSSKFQRPVDSFFAISIRRGWQGIAYLLLQNGFNLMEAIRDAMNEHQFKYVVALMTKVQDEVVRKSDHNNQNLFHIFAIKGHRAPVDLAKKIFEGLIDRGVDCKTFDSFGKAPIHYAAENNFIYLEDRLLENNVDANTLDSNGLSILHIAAKANTLNVGRLQKFSRYKIDINAMFNQYGRKMAALHYIAEQGNDAVEREMLRLGADPNLEDSEGLTALQRAFIRRTLSTYRLTTYLNEKANINKIFSVKNGLSSRKYTLLLYAAEKAWSDYEDVLLTNGADARIEDEDHRTAFAIALSQRSPTMQLPKLRLYVKCKAPLSTLFSCKIRRRTMKVTPVLYLLNTRENIDFPFIKELLDSGVSINDTDDDGYSAIIYAIRRNNMQSLKLFLECRGLDKNMRDKYGKTPIHHVVTPMDYASYENTEMLKLLATVFDINAPDAREKPPIYYSYFQDSGTMKKALLELGAVDHRPANELQRQATSIIAGVEWPEEVDFEVDAEKYLKSQEDSKMLVEKYDAEPVDECVHNRHNLEVVNDENLGAYSLYMTKVDIKKGEYGEYLFYRMQVLYDKNRDNYILLTKWGRIGEQGMHQETPFGTKDECINEFLKIFKDKSGNEWKNRTKFQKFEHKYKLMNTSTRKNQNDYLQPIDWNDKTIPRSRLDPSIRNVVKAMSDVKLYHSWFGRHNINTKLLPFGKLSKEVIFEAKKILLELKDLIEELQGKGTQTDEDVQTVLKLKEKIMDNSSKYYELIPNTQFRFSPVQPIQNISELVDKVTMVNDMIDFEVSAKILLGAMSHIKVSNPLDYCFEALGIRLLPLARKQREHKLITQYVKNGYPGASSDFVEKIFALERRGEAERISQWKGEKNRMYLWHGSKLINFMGILSQGLRIAPPEAPATGYMFGKGIYFADTFSKSYGYTQNNYYSYGGSDNNTKLLVLCEVALGEIMEQKQANYITKLQAPYNSVLGRGRQGPDPAQNIILANGAIVPIGKHMQHPQTDENGNYIYYSLNYNEYIVYDVSQVRMRYLVQVK